MADVTTSGAARLLGLSLGTVRALADAGDLPHRRTSGGHRRFTEADLARFLARGVKVPAAPAVRVAVWMAAALAVLHEAEADLGPESPMATPFRAATRALVAPARSGCPDTECVAQTG